METYVSCYCSQLTCYCSLVTVHMLASLIVQNASRDVVVIIFTHFESCMVGFVGSVCRTETIYASISSFQEQIS